MNPESMLKNHFRSMAECDRIQKACESAKAKVAVAHRNRYHPALPVVRRLIREGVIGKVVALRGRGKEDHRGGGEDLWVLGTHVFDLLNAIAGDPVSCSAEIGDQWKSRILNPGMKDWDRWRAMKYMPGGK